MLSGSVERVYITETEMPVYVVVGASRGIGLAFVKQLAAEPANTVIAVNRKQGQESVERLHEVTADLNDLSSLQASVRGTVCRFC